MTAVQSRVVISETPACSRFPRRTNIRVKLLAAAGVIALVWLAGFSSGAPLQLPISLALVPVATVLAVMTAETPRRIAFYSCDGAAITATLAAAFAQLAAERHHGNRQIALDPILSWAPIATVTATIAVALAIYVADWRHTFDSRDSAAPQPR